MDEEGVIIIAGASQGLGKQLAIQAVQLQLPVALLSRTKPNFSELNNDLIEKISSAIYLVDLTNYENTRKIFCEVIKKYKKIKALINCAATWTGGKAIKELSVKEMEESISLNFFTCFNAVKALLEFSENLIKPASIINVGATASLRGNKKCAAFAVGKGALRQFTQSLARELWPEEIHVAHVIIDGLINNERTKKINPNMHIDRFIRENSIADSILKIISQEKSCWTFEWDLRPYNENW